MATIDVGAKAPDFTLVDQDRNQVRLSDQAGKNNVVLLFFPLAFSPVCTNEMCTFRDSIAELGKANATVYGISVDSPFALKAFQKDNQLPFSLLSDFNKDVVKQYGVFAEDLVGLKGVAKRSVFVIDKNGVVRYRWVSDDARKEPEYGQVRQVTQQLS